MGKKNKQIQIGIVVSDKMNKTIVARVQRSFQHKLYKKFIRKHKKYKVHDEYNECEVGDKIKFELCRPLSKGKRWKFVEIVEKRR
ncbi:MAG: 30S ribosomal protein S17 [Candidatus Cloacimonadota bacterium]|nr:MAG: 30S ribosomal protein S17 [Candidatus Cloacimonadota bacterium]